MDRHKQEKQILRKERKKKKTLKNILWKSSHKEKKMNE